MALIVMIFIFLVVALLLYDRRPRRTIPDASPSPSAQATVPGTNATAQAGGWLEQRYQTALEEQVRLEMEAHKHIRQLVKRHAAALRLKRKQLIIRDAYGRQVTTAWLKECAYFVRHLTRYEKYLPRLIALNKESVRLHSMTVGFHDSEYLEEECAKYLDRCSVEGEPAEYVDSIIQDMEMKAEPRDRAADQDMPESLSGREFEVYCSEILTSAGWLTSLTARSGDQGADLIACKGPHKVILQCKKVSGTVGNRAVQEVIAGRDYEQGTFAAVVTNSTFSKSAVRLAGMSDVALLHHTELHTLDDLVER